MADLWLHFHSSLRFRIRAEQYPRGGWKDLHNFGRPSAGVCAPLARFGNLCACAIESYFRASHGDRSVMLLFMRPVGMGKQDYVGLLIVSDRFFICAVKRLQCSFDFRSLQVACKLAPSNMCPLRPQEFELHG
jgi:hypothetical protein